MSAYIKKKLKVLHDFRIKLTDAQLEHLNALPTESAVDSFVRTLIKQALA